MFFRRLLHQNRLSLLLSLLAFVGFLTVRTLLFGSPPLTAQAAAPAPPPLPAAAIAHLQQAVRLRTVSVDTATAPDTSQFLGFGRLLRRAYPLLHRRLLPTVLGGYTLRFEWKGQDTTLSPVVLLAHYDVVPVETATTGRWQHAPFSGDRADGRIWGRGTIDNKGNVIALLEAVETALQQNYRPARTVFLVLGHDEELGGWRGARLAAQQLQLRGLRPAFVLDEGGYITQKKVPGMTGKPVALIGTAEKGYLSLQLTARLPGGHSSMPEAETALGLVATAVTTLQQQSFPASLTPAMQDFARYVGPHLPFTKRMAFANQWLMRPLILRAYSNTAAGAAAVRTTLVPTMFQAGIKDNVVPTTATATVNVRLLPGTSAADALAQVRAWLPDPRVGASVMGRVSEPTAAASPESLGYRLVAAQLRHLVPGVLPTPFLFIAQSDGRHFQPLTPNVFRFSATNDPHGLHGVDESVAETDFLLTYRFFAGLLRALPAKQAI